MDIIVKNSGIVRIESRKDALRGNLFFAEASKHIPFDIKRVYFMNHLSPATNERGGHAHKTNQQAIFSVNGSFTLNLDDGEKKQSIVLDDPSIGIFLGPKLWHTMSDFSDGSLVLVFSDSYFDEADYIRQYSDFIAKSR